MNTKDFVARKPNVTITLKELRKAKGLSAREMAERIGMRYDDYRRVEAGYPPAWMFKAVRFFEACFDLGYLPENIYLQERQPRGGNPSSIPQGDHLPLPDKTT